MKTARHISELIRSESDLMSPLAGRAHAERICQAIVDQYQLGECLVAHENWTGGRVYRVPDPAVMPDVAWPMVTVSPAIRDQPWVMSGESEASFDVSLVMYYYEPRYKLEAEDLTAPSFAGYLWAWLTRNRQASCLAVTRYGDQPLTSQPPALGSLNYGDFARLAGQDTPLDEDGMPFAERYLEQTITYRYRVSRDTGQPPGFQPND